jgi:hypothetical protein
VEPLLPKDQRFDDQRDEGQRRFEHGCDAGRHIFFRPEEQTILGNEHEKSNQNEAAPLGSGWRRLPAETHETVQQNARNEESGSGGEQRRHFLDRDPNGQEGGSPQNINREKRQQHADIEGLLGRVLAGASITVVVAIDSYHFTSAIVTCQDGLEG